MTATRYLIIDKVNEVDGVLMLDINVLRNYVALAREEILSKG